MYVYIECVTPIVALLDALCACVGGASGDGLSIFIGDKRGWSGFCFWLFVYKK